MLHLQLCQEQAYFIINIMPMVDFNLLQNQRMVLNGPLSPYPLYERWWISLYVYAWKIIILFSIIHGKVTVKKIIICCLFSPLLNDQDIDFQYYGLEIEARKNYVIDTLDIDYRVCRWNYWSKDVGIYKCIKILW